MVAPKRYDVFLVPLDPAQGSEMKKTRPCVVVSPDESNRLLRTVVIAPLTSKPRDFPGRVRVLFQKQEGQMATDQLRAVDKTRLIRKVGVIRPEDRASVSAALVEFFS